MTHTDSLDRVLVRLADDSKWCQGVSARRASGQPCSPRDRLAVSWCMSGAVAVDAEPMLAVEVLRRLDDAAGCNAAYYNDTHAHSEVMAVIAAALRAAAADEGYRISEQAAAVIETLEGASGD